MFEQRDAEAPKQEEFWVEKTQLPAVKAGTFYRKLDETLREMEFAEKVRELCRPSYKDASSGGRPERSSRRKFAPGIAETASNCLIECWKAAGHWHKFVRITGRR